MNAVWAILAAVDLAAVYVCYQKGKNGLVVTGLIALLPPLTFFLPIVPVIGALTPGRPEAAKPQQHPPPMPFGSTMGTTSPPLSSLPPPPASASLTAGSSAPPQGAEVASVIRLFLKDAVVDGVIDQRTYSALIQRLSPAPVITRPPAAPADTSTAQAHPAAPPSAAARVAPAPPVGLPPPPVQYPKPPPPPPVQVPPPVRMDGATAGPATPVTPHPKPPSAPMPPRQPSRVSIKVASLWDSIASDVAVHGFVYLGVLLTFVSVLGFMMFAFEDLPISAKPFVEFLIVLTFFGWAWLLRHQNARNVAQAMELLGGAILPLVWFAALVDGASVPPDVEGAALIPALAVSCAGISGAYWLISRRYANSMLRFLAWPMVWVAAGALGYAFKTDEHLARDAITRLVAPQPAFIALAITASLVFLTLRPNSRLAEPTFRSAIVGIPSAYVLTFGLSFPDARSGSWPMLAAGAATVVSVELVARRFGWLEQLRTIRPYLYAAVGVPFVMIVGLGWGGVVVALGYILMTEISIRLPRLGPIDLTAAAAGAAIGTLMASTEPASMAVAWGAVSVWSHVRRRRDVTPSVAIQILEAVAALAPIGLLLGLSQLLTLPAALTIVGVSVTLAALLVRGIGAADRFDSVWFPAAATVLGLIAARFWVVEATSGTLIVVVLVLSATTVALGRRWPTGNLWLAAAHLAAALAVVLGSANVEGANLAVAWSITGLLVTVVSAATHGGRRLRVAPGHLTVLGHVLGMVAFAASRAPHGFVIAMCGWAIGWIVALVVYERDDSSDPISAWSAAFGGTAKIDLETVRAVATAPMTAGAVAGAVAAVFVEVTDVTVQLAWLGPTLSLVAFVYAVASRLWFASDFGRAVFAWAASLLAVASIGFAWLEPVATIVSAIAVLGVRLILIGVQRLPWLTWATWLMLPVAGTAFASIVGVPDESLPTATLGIAAAMMLLGLWADEAVGGRRLHGQFVRIKWMLPPTVFGALLVPSSVALLWAFASGTSEWASSMGALSFAIASVMLRRNVWVTATLSAVALAIGMDAADIPTLARAYVWGVLGLAAVLVAPLVSKRVADDLAGVGHAIGAIGLIYLDSVDAAMPVLSLWGLGWLAAVVSHELGGPSISRVLEQASRWWEDEHDNWIAEGSRALPPAMAVTTSTAAALLLYDRFVGFDEARAWTSAVLAGLGLFYAVMARFVASSKPARSILGWSAVGLATSAVLVAIGEALPIVVAATTFIAVRVLLIGVLPRRWLSWPAWTMPFAIVMAAGHALGVPGQSLYLLSLATGVAMLIGSLVFDDVVNGRRATLEGIRLQWLGYPFVVGLLAVPLSLAPVFALDTSTVGFASLAAAAGYAVVAILLKAGSATFPAIGLAVFGTAVLLPWSSADHPWILVVMAATVVAWSFAAERIQSDDAASNFWTRWDLPALLAAHVVVGVALALTLDGTLDPATWVAAGALSIVVGFWRSSRWWLDAGLVLMVIGSANAAEPWLMLALAATTARGMYGVRRDGGVERGIDHAIAVAGFIALWIDVGVQLEWAQAEASSIGSMTAGLVALVVAVTSWLAWVKKDTLVVWSAVAVAGVSAALVAALVATPRALDGPWNGLGIVLVAVATEQWARGLHRNARFATPVIAALGWFVGVTGLAVSPTAAAWSTVAVFGTGLVVLMPIGARFTRRAADGDARHPRNVTRAWAVVTMAGLAAASAVAVVADTPRGWWVVAASSAFTTVAVVMGRDAVGISRLRTASGIPALFVLVAALLAIETEPVGIGLALITVAAMSTLAAVFLVRGERESEWTATSVLTSLAAVAFAVPSSVVEYPATELAVLILITVGAQAIAYGLVFDRWYLLAIGPPILGLATLVLIVESGASSVVWYTIPIGVVMLAEADLLQPLLRGDSDAHRHIALLILEWSGVALIGLPPLVEMFRSDIMFGLVGFSLGAGLLIWALLTKVKRRLLAAAIVATFSVVLSLAATGASNVQESAAFWIIGGGVGLSIMLIAGTIEAYRSRAGALMRRLWDLMEEWE